MVYCVLRTCRRSRIFGAVHDLCRVRNGNGWVFSGGGEGDEGTVTRSMDNLLSMTFSRIATISAVAYCTGKGPLRGFPTSFRYP